MRSGGFSMNAGKLIVPGFAHVLPLVREGTLRDNLFLLPFTVRATALLENFTSMRCRFRGVASPTMAAVLDDEELDEEDDAGL